jgi:hypothetical protein
LLFGIFFAIQLLNIIIMQKGQIRVQTENIFPIIKKFLYSDHEIFLRELVSNAVDASQKLKTLSGKGEVKGAIGDLRVDVVLKLYPLLIMVLGCQVPKWTSILTKWHLVARRSL